MPPNFRACDVTFGMRSTTGSITLGNEVTPEDRAKIEATIATKLPRRTAAEYKDAARRSTFLRLGVGKRKAKGRMTGLGRAIPGRSSQIYEYRMMPGFGPRKALGEFRRSVTSRPT